MEVDDYQFELHATDRPPAEEAPPLLLNPLGRDQFLIERGHSSLGLEVHLRTYRFNDLYERRLVFKCGLGLLPVRRLFLVEDHDPAVFPLIQVLLSPLQQCGLERTFEVIGDASDLLFEEVEEAVCHTVQHLRQPGSALGTRRRQIDFQEPGV